MSINTSLSWGERFPSELFLLNHVYDAHARGVGRRWSKVSPRRAGSPCEHEYASFDLVGDHEDLVCDACHTILDPADYEDADAEPEQTIGSAANQIRTPVAHQTGRAGSGDASHRYDQVSRIAALEAEVARLNKAKRIAELEEQVARLRAELDNQPAPSGPVTKIA